MRLEEIINRSFTPYPVSDEDAEAVSRKLKIGAELLSPTEGGRYSIWQNDQTYLVQAGEEVAGWVILEPEKLPDGRQVMALDLIYFRPEFRGTKALAILLHGVRASIEHPILLPASSAFFKGGAELLAALAKRGQVELSAISPSGDTRSVTSVDDLKRSEGLLIEDVPPLTVPATDLLAQPTGKRVIFGWYSDNDTVG